MNIIKSFEKYEKYKKNNLPRSVYDKELDTSLYIYYLKGIMGCEDNFLENSDLHLYDFPKTFSIPKHFEKYYSLQELKYIKRFKNYFALIELKDKDYIKDPVNRYRNKKQEKYERSYIFSYMSDMIKKLINDEVNFIVIDQILSEAIIEHFEEFNALIVDEEENFKLFIKITSFDIKHYIEIKDFYQISDKQDFDDCICFNFEIIEILN